MAKNWRAYERADNSGPIVLQSRHILRAVGSNKYEDAIALAMRDGVVWHVKGELEDFLRAMQHG